MNFYPFCTFRKKTDSGSSVGSSKTKEPWPLLNNGKNATNGDTVINSPELLSSSLPDEMLCSSDHLATLPVDDGKVSRHG